MGIARERHRGDGRGSVQHGRQFDAELRAAVHSHAQIERTADRFQVLDAARAFPVVDVGEDDVVVTLDYVLTVASEVVDSSEDSDPVEFLQGRGNIITGLEKAIYGMKVGDKLSVDIPAAEGYGGAWRRHKGHIIYDLETGKQDVGGKP